MTTPQDELSALHKSMTDAIDGDSKFDGLITHWLADVERAMAERDRRHASHGELLAALEHIVPKYERLVGKSSHRKDSPIHDFMRRAAALRVGTER